MTRPGGPRARGESGQTLPLLAIFMVVLLGFAGLVVDVGHAYVLKRHLQASVDMAVLSGARNLPDTASADAALLADNYDVLPQPDAVPSACSSGGSNRVCLRADTSVDTTFLRLFDVDELDIGAEATAGIASYTGFSHHLAPWAVEDASVKYGTLFDIHGQKTSPGNFGAVDLPTTDAEGKPCQVSPGGSVYRDTLAGDQLPCTVRMNDVIPTEGGLKTGPTDQGLDDRKVGGMSVQSPFDHQTLLDGEGRLTVLDHPNVMQVPVIDEWPNGKKDVRVVGFVWFVLTSRNGGDVKGYLVPATIPPGMTCLTSSGSQVCPTGAYDPATGSKVIRLLD